MRRLWVAMALLALVFCGVLYNSYNLKGFTQEVTDVLEEARQAAESDEWVAAETLTEQAYDRWRERDTYLHVTLRHIDIDEIYTDFHEVQQFLKHRDIGEHSAAHARLVTKLGLLYEAEQLTLKNVF